MEIISLYFAGLAIISIFVFYLLNQKNRIWFLTVSSCFFIAIFNFYLLIYVLVYSFINYYLGNRIFCSKNKKLFLRTGIIFNISQLIVLKYASFTIDPVFQLFHLNFNLGGVSEIIGAVGVSYFTLQSIGYLINIKMDWEKPERNYYNFLLFIIFYPKFISGPIERSNHFLPQLKIFKPFDGQRISDGLRIALTGFFKKVVIANSLGLIITDVYTDVSSFSGSDLWLITLIQPLYLYFDFSGYTDIAIGFAMTFGIDLAPNFNLPFSSENVTTFWRRFHMSLSSWFNDYVFKQTAFRYRKLGSFSPVFAVVVTFTLFGIWHGSGWNFMMLGLLQALAVSFEYLTKSTRIKFFSKIPGSFRIWAGRILTYLFFGLSLVLFFSPDVFAAKNYYSRLTDLNLSLSINPGFNLLLSSSFMIFFGITGLLKSDFKEYFGIIERFWLNHKIIRITVYYIALFMIISGLRGNMTFIYEIF